MSQAKFPYHGIPREARWKDVMAGRPPSDIDPHLGSTLRITPEQRVASAGSCFAQRIAEALQAAGYNYMQEEPGSPFMNAEERAAAGYGLYSARYGNVYTALQLLQLLRRAYGRMTPKEPLWRLPSGAWVDPFRPGVQEGGFISEAECLWDRDAHMAAVRRVFENSDLFIFTLGLTECWLSREDGAAFPVCPGSSMGGTFDPDRHYFHNFSVSEVVEHMDTFLAEFREVNPRAQVLLTVSPVPLMATYEPRHVLQATVYSKSVLRVAAEELVRKHEHVHYFASYEIVNSTGDSAKYFLDDKRGVAKEAVEHVIACFHRQFTGAAGPVPAAAPRPASAPVVQGPQPVCDEEKVMSALARAEGSAS